MGGGRMERSKVGGEGGGEAGIRSETNEGEGEEERGEADDLSKAASGVDSIVGMSSFPGPREGAVPVRRAPFVIASMLWTRCRRCCRKGSILLWWQPVIVVKVDVVPT